MFFAVAWYLIWDFRLPNAGLIIGGNISLAAWLILLLVIVAACVMGHCLLRMSSRYTRQSHTGFIGREPRGDKDGQ